MTINNFPHLPPNKNVWNIEKPLENYSTKFDFPEKWLDINCWKIVENEFFQIYISCLKWKFCGIKDGFKQIKIE